MDSREERLACLRQQGPEFLRGAKERLLRIISNKPRVIVRRRGRPSYGDTWETLSGYEALILLPGGFVAIGEGDYKSTALRRALARMVRLLTMRLILSIEKKVG